MATKFVDITTTSGSDHEKCGYHYHDGRPVSVAWAVLNDVRTPLGGARMRLARKSESTK